MTMNEFKNSKYYDEMSKWALNRQEKSLYPSDEEMYEYYKNNKLDDVIEYVLFDALVTEEINIMKGLYIDL